MSKIESQDWSRSPDFIASDVNALCYSKGLKHGSDGSSDRQQHEAFWSAIRERSSEKLEKLSPAVPWPGAVEKSWHPAAADRLQITVPWVDPCSGQRAGELFYYENSNSQWVRLG